MKSSYCSACFVRRMWMGYSIVLSLATTIMLMGCKDVNNSELRIKHHFNALELQRNFKLISKVRELRNNVHSETAKAESAEALRIGALHQSYLKQKSKKNLLAYADSMSRILERSHFRNDSIQDELGIVRAQVAASGDSLDVLNLFFWAITAENMMIENHLSQVTVFEDHFKMTLPSFLEKERYAVGDTVRISFQSFPEYDLNFDEINCTHQLTKEKLQFHMLKVGPSYILSFIPKNAGMYAIDGMVGVGGDFTNGMFVSNQIIVE